MFWPLVKGKGAKPASSLNAEGPKLKLLMLNLVAQVFVTTTSCTRLWVLMARAGKLIWRLAGTTVMQLLCATTEGAAKVTRRAAQRIENPKNFERETIWWVLSAINQLTRAGSISEARRFR